MVTSCTENPVETGCDTFLVANHSGKANPAQTDPAVSHAALPPVLRGDDPGGPGQGVGPAPLP